MTSHFWQGLEGPNSESASTTGCLNAHNIYHIWQLYYHDVLFYRCHHRHLVLFWYMSRFQASRAGTKRWRQQTASHWFVSVSSVARNAYNRQQHDSESFELWLQACKRVSATHYSLCVRLNQKSEGLRIAAVHLWRRAGSSGAIETGSKWKKNPK